MILVAYYNIKENRGWLGVGLGVALGVGLGVAGAAHSAHDTHQPECHALPRVAF
jgi:hypothetical protein